MSWVGSAVSGATGEPSDARLPVQALLAPAALASLRLGQWHPQPSRANDVSMTEDQILDNIKFLLDELTSLLKKHDIG